ncbi:hypothetical protein CDCA_CDCA14G3826 [Cyanidium caldarium]|uniref:RWD domain-containing protein n=1 Tax=Cyanidium caldarium TaxID=2771 RepID=A0AAV9J090_CYACA|nr:hypothetical protein CDCA_CDCA14G3826 [Cyanidium caldarium]
MADDDDDAAAESEQVTEAEALEAIFGDDFHELERDGRRRRWVLKLSAPSAELELRFTLPERYPFGAAPQVLVQAVRGLAAQRRAVLQQHLEAVAAASIGQPSVYTVHAAAMDWLATADPAGRAVAGDASPQGLLRGKGVRGDEDGGSRFETVEGSLEQRVADASAETASVQRWIGTPVTPESFAVWRGEFERFLQEQGIAEDVYGTDAAQRSSLKPTGRELFQQHSELFQNDAEGDEEPESATAADALVHSERDIDRSLFAP